MARTKTKKEEVFQQTQIDSHAIEVAPGQVKVDGIDKLIPLDAYLSNKEKTLLYLQQQEKELYQTCQRFIQDNLPIRQGGQFQEDCRMLSWAYAQNPDQNLLKGLRRVCPDLALLTPTQNQVQAHHLSHFIRAYMAILLGLPPSKVGPASNLCRYAQEEEEAFQSRITVWEYLLSLTPTEKKKVIELQNLTPMQELVRRQQTIELELQEIKTLIKEILQCLPTTSKHSIMT